MNKKISLAELAAKYGTDKQIKDHNYVSMYERLLKTIKVNSLLEVGLGAGASVKMWIEYFKQAKIYCIEDFGDENKEVWNGADGKINGLKLINGDSTNQETWDKVPANLDVIIDDGNHHPDSQITTFARGFQHLRSGGLYFIEDTHCNFEERYTGGHDLLYKGIFEMIIQQQTPNVNWGGNFYQARYTMPEYVRDIYSYHFYKSIICFEKA